MHADSPIVAKMLCVLKCLLLTINLDDEEDEKADAGARWRNLSDGVRSIDLFSLLTRVNAAIVTFEKIVVQN